MGSGVPTGIGAGVSTVMLSSIESSLHLPAVGADASCGDIDCDFQYYYNADGTNSNFSSSFPSRVSHSSFLIPYRSFLVPRIRSSSFHTPDVEMNP